MKSSFKLFVCRDFESKLIKYNSNREALVKEAALFCGVAKQEVDNAAILREAKGKPHFDKLNMHFSVSHSDALWTCLMGQSCCGLDVQYIKPCNFQKIAGRFFSENENKYVAVHGIEGFFEIWAMREAYGKYTGEGFFGTMPDFVNGGKLITTVSVNIAAGGVDSADYHEKTVKFIHLNIEAGLKCVACIEKDVDTIDIKEL